MKGASYTACTDWLRKEATPHIQGGRRGMLRRLVSGEVRRCAKGHFKKRGCYALIILKKHKIEGQHFKPSVLGYLLSSITLAFSFFSLAIKVGRISDLARGMAYRGKYCTAHACWDTPPPPPPPSNRFFLWDRAW